MGTLRITISLLFLSQLLLAQELVSGLKTLFNHKSHQSAFGSSGIKCTDCHSFSVKARESDPLGAGVPMGFLVPNKKTCHQCHLENVKVPRPNQCQLCHQEIKNLMPADHKLGWKIRHGQMAQMDRDSCKQCHGETTCTQCHTQRDTNKPNVHRAGFRMMHSIEARANPQSCVVCHATTSTCLQCHSRGLQ